MPRSYNALGVLMPDRIELVELDQQAGRSLLGVAGTSTADVAAITAATEHHMVVNTAGGLAWQLIAAGQLGTDAVETVKIKDSNVTLAKIEDITGPSVLGKASGTGAPAEITAGADYYVLTRIGGTLGFLPVSTNSIVDANVTLAKIATQADDTVLGNVSGGVASPSALTAAQLKTLLDLDSWSGYDTTGGTSIVATAKVTIDTEFRSTSGSVFSLSSGELTINKTGPFRFSGSFTPEETASGRASAEAWIAADTGGGFAEITGSRMRSTCRTTNEAPGDTGSTVFDYDVTSGDIFKMNAIRSHGSVAMQTEADMSRLAVQELLK